MAAILKMFNFPWIANNAAMTSSTITYDLIWDKAFGINVQSDY